MKALRKWSFLTISLGANAEEGLTNYTKRSDTIRVTGATALTTSNVQTIRSFEKIFFLFWRAQKKFLGPKNLVWP